MKKIEETKKKAEDVMAVRVRNHETKQEKNMLKEQRDHEARQLAAKTDFRRQEQMKNIHYNKASH